jgi:hypothetical protein
MPSAPTHSPPKVADTVTLTSCALSVFAVLSALPPVYARIPFFLAGAANNITDQLQLTAISYRSLPPVCVCSYTSSAGMDGVFTTRPALELLWGYEDSLLQLLDTLLPPGSLQDGPRVR